LEGLINTGYADVRTVVAKSALAQSLIEGEVRG